MARATHLVLVPGAGSDPVYWEALQTELTVRGQVSTAVDLPCEDADLLLADYAEAVADASTCRCASRQVGTWACCPTRPSWAKTGISSIAASVRR